MPCHAGTPREMSDLRTVADDFVFLLMDFDRSFVGRRFSWKDRSSLV